MKTKILVIEQGRRASYLLKGAVGYVDGCGESGMYVVSGKQIGAIRWHDVKVIGEVEYYWRRIFS